jgi:hypothetical protein
MFQEALHQLDVFYSEIKEALKPPWSLPLSDLWLGCEACGKWRVVTREVYALFQAPGSQFFCELATDRPAEYRECETEDDEARLAREAALLQQSKPAAMN